jgi:hypothetical protein
MRLQSVLKRNTVEIIFLNCNNTKKKTVRLDAFVPTVLFVIWKCFRIFNFISELLKVM